MYGENSMRAVQYLRDMLRFYLCRVSSVNTRKAHSMEISDRFPHSGSNLENV